MTGMEHAIERAKRVLDAVDRNHDLDSGDLASSGEYARALAEAGLLAPAPLTEEWATIDRAEGKPMWSNVRWSASSEENAMEKAHAFGYEVQRRYVSDWEVVDRAEGDGRADQ